MEDPATWGQAEKVIDQALAAHEKQKAEIPDLCGLSLPRLIADALRKAGLLHDGR